ncbi:hypothetical protein SNE40_012584 [Patella caerulea]|uniref:Cytochrome c oxidase subunit 5A, mitochondrial n=1 Tax=Patella caerulea TaxID=87958 RepID=A0AAN8JSQ5_PATCE
MFRAVQKIGSVVQTVSRQSLRCSAIASTTVRYGHGQVNTSDTYLKKIQSERCDGWMIRSVINDLQGEDFVAEPELVIEAMKVCRKLNDYALAVRFLEAIKEKSSTNKDIWPYMLQEIRPTLTDLGILTPEEMGYDKPELAKRDVFSM